MPKAFSYIRFSTPEQAQGDSERRQTSDADRYAKRKGLKMDTLKDLGVSGFKGRNRKHGCLGAFLEKVHRGKIPKGSFLIVESLDRLSREPLDRAADLVFSLLRAGIHITTLMPFHEWGPDHIDDLATRVLIEVYASRAHEESKTKSKRIRDAWIAKMARINEEKLTKRIPAWLQLSKDRKTFSVDREKAAIVKRIYRMAADGQGFCQIVRTLNREGVRSLARVAHWQVSYVNKILKNRAVVGEYQPCVGHWTERKPRCEPVANYYPAVIDEAQFYRVQEILTKRYVGRGPKGHQVRNLFTGLLHDAQDGCSMHIIDKGKRSTGPIMVSSGAKYGREGSVYVSFPYEVFEHAFLKWTTELKAEDVLPAKSAPIEDQLMAAKGKLDQVNGKISKLKSKLLGVTDQFDSLTDLLLTLETQRKEVLATVGRLTAEQATEDNPLERTQELVKLLKEAKDPTELRSRLKARIRSLVQEIRVFIHVEGPAKHAHVQVFFESGQMVRDFQVSCKALKNLPNPLPVKMRPHFIGNWMFTSTGFQRQLPAKLFTAGNITLDLRNSDSVRQIRECIESIPAA